MYSDSLKTVDAELLDRYLARTASPSEVLVVETAMGQNPDLAAAITVFMSMPLAPGGQMEESASARGWTRFTAAVGGDGASRLSEYGAERALAPAPGRFSWRSSASARRTQWIAKAGIAMGIAAGAVVLALVLNPGSSVAPARDYSTAAGERTSLTLADGSQVMLGPSSRLRVATGFGSRSRDVLVHGQAYFAVAQSDAQPFTVSVGQARLRVLGTSFGVRHYDSDAQVTVAVQSGRVAVGAQGGSPLPPLVAGVNEIAVVAGNRAVVHQSVADVAHLTSWTRGRLDFRDTPLREALPELERWFDVSFQLADSTVANVRLTGGFQSQSIDDLEATLGFVLPVVVIRDGRTITIRSR